MPTLFVSEGKIIRKEIKDFLHNLSKKKKLKILDIGASANPWLGELITDTIDIFPIKRNKINSHVGDANLISTYEKFEDNEFDFVNCTHTLEDLRSPDIAITEMKRIAKSGFIAVPNRHTEVSNLTKFSPFGSRFSLGGNHIGFAHHRWFFNNPSPNTLEAYAKWSGICGTESIYEKLIKKIARFPILRRKYLSIITKFGAKSFGYHKWVKPEFIDVFKNEFSFIWVKDFKFSYFNNDFAGDGDPETFRLFNEFVSNDPVDVNNTLNSAFSELEKTLNSSS